MIQSILDNLAGAGQRLKASANSDEIRVRIEGFEQSLPEQLRGILSQRGTILGIAAVTATAVLIGSLFTQPDYMAEARLLVKMGREFVYRSEFDKSNPSQMFRLFEAINSEIEILESKSLVGDVVSEIGLENLYPDIALGNPDPATALRKAVDAFKEALMANGIPDSSVIRVAFTHHDPDLATRAVNLLVERLQDRHVEVFGDSQADFLETQAETEASALANAEHALAEFREQQGIYDLDHQQTMLLEKDETLAAELEDVEVQLADVQAALSGAVDENFAQIAALRGSPALEGAQAELFRLRMERERLMGSYRSDSRSVRKLQEGIAVVEGYLVDAVQSEAKSLLLRRDALRAQIADTRAEVRRAEDGRRTLRSLEREVLKLETSYLAIQGKLREARAAAELDAQRFLSLMVIDPATAPVEPLGIGISTRLILGLMTGLALGIAVAAFRSLTRGSAGPSTMVSVGGEESWLFLE